VLIIVCMCFRSSSSVCVFSFIIDGGVGEVCKNDNQSIGAVGDNRCLQY
jgi:hypothetical protein